ncbi:hypothetical protein [Methylobrevis albus]|uniref:Lipoprotein n=1 Tax=Methylobrevis albus TaxID=2793297 RepID=A0A931MZG7_9HYPH|nr:hypothetical protein [Methylobrevis albus]MBH0237731.1 hypothetical protein [Methylobrevis albus]
MLRVAAVLLALLLSACVATRPALPPSSTMIQSVEDQKRDIAVRRNRGEIFFADAARQQYAVQKANYSLTPNEERFWAESIANASLVDSRRITPQEFHNRVRVLYARYVTGA